MKWYFWSEKMIPLSRAVRSRLQTQEIINQFSACLFEVKRKHVEDFLAILSWFLNFYSEMVPTIDSVVTQRGLVSICPILISLVINKIVSFCLALTLWLKMCLSSGIKISNDWVWLFFFFPCR